MGEKQNGPFQLSFNASLKISFQGSRVTSDGGLILVRELDEQLGFGELKAKADPPALPLTITHKLCSQHDAELDVDKAG